MVKVLSVIGATASGKSDLALQLAQKYNGEIISCDSVQIYKYFDIGSAKPTPHEMNLVPHHLIDLLQPNEQCNAGLWRDLALQKVEEVHQRNKLPIIVGGTGLYLKSLYIGMFEQKSRDEEYRHYLKNIENKQGLESLYLQLEQKDPIYAQKIARTDSLRIIRALEAIYVTGISFSELHNHNSKPNWQWFFTQTTLSREQIYQKVETRVHKMIDIGLIEETKHIIQTHGSESPVFKTIGYRHVLEYLNQLYNKEDMIAKLILDTRHYVKRQQTLFRSLIREDLLIHPNDLITKEFSL